MSTAHERAWKQRGFADFSRGRFGSGENLYVNARGTVEMVQRFDLNNNGCVDIVLPNSHGYLERGPTWVYEQACGPGPDWPRQELPNDSGWMSRIADVDGDGYNDLIVVNGENGVTSELDSYVYWGGPNGLTGARTEFPTAGAYDVALHPGNDGGLPGLIFPSAWVDHHNPGRPRLVQMFEQVSPREFIDVSERYGLIGTGAVSVACEDLNGDGRPELVVANYRHGFEYDTESCIYWGTESGFAAETPLRLPTHFAMQVILGDLNNDGWKEIVFAGGNRVAIFWNAQGSFDPRRVTNLDAEGIDTMFCRGAIRAEIADVDGDGRNELIVATAHGVEIRTQDNLQEVDALLPLKYCSWVTAADMDGNGRLDLVASRYHDGRFYETSSAIFRNGPDGFAPERATWLDTAGAVGCTAGDLNGNGKPVIVFNNTLRSWSQFNPDFPCYVYLGNPQHEYGPENRLELPTGGLTNTYAIADLDLDGYPELVIPTLQGIRIFHGGPDGPKPDHYTDLPHQGNPFLYVFVADLNRNGWLDIVCGAGTYDDSPETMAKSSLIYWGGPDGFAPKRSTTLPTYSPGEVFVTDLNRNGWLDIVYGDKRGFVGIFPGGPDGYSRDSLIRVPLPGTVEPMIAVPNCADVNGDGWLDLIVSVLGHYDRSQSGFFVCHGGPDGFSPDRIEFHPTVASSILVSVADINNNGHLDLLVPAYSTQFRRDLPAFIFWGDGESFDFEHPFVMHCDACCAFMAIDITGNGYRDVLAVCHRDDLGHQVDSLLFWNGPEGLSTERVTRLPGLGPHLSCPRDFGNTYTREPTETFVSAPEPIDGGMPARIRWDADTPEKTGLRFQLRWAASAAALEAAPWCGPDGEGTFYERSGQDIRGIQSRPNWLQYRAEFTSLNGCRSAKLREVCIDLASKPGA